MTKRTDADRAKLQMNSPALAGHFCWNPDVYMREFWQEGNHSASNIFGVFKGEGLHFLIMHLFKNNSQISILFNK